MRSKDRLSELRQNANGGLVYNDTVEVLLPAADEKHVLEIDQIIEEVEKIRTWIRDIAANTLLLRHIYSDPTFHTNKNLQDNLDSIIASSNGIGLKICGALRQFEPRAAAGRNDARGRIARLQYAATRQLYSDALTEHQKLLQMIRDGQYDLLQEQIRLTNLMISDEECQDLLETRNISLFVDNLQADTAEAQRALRDVESRHEELLRIEGSVREVHELFVQMAHLVAQQQDLVDTVEYYATQASELVVAGGKDLHKGTVTRRKSRNKKIGLILCLTSGFLIVLFVLIAT